MRNRCYLLYLFFSKSLRAKRSNPPTPPLTKGGKRGFFGFMIIIFLLPSSLEARLLNLNGVIELSYSNIRTTQADQKTETQSLQERYSIGSFGNLALSRIGNYNANFTFNKQDSWRDGEGQSGLKVSTYNLNINLLPRWHPVSLYANRTVTVSEFHQLTKNTIDRYGLTWAVTARYLPRTNLNLDQTVTEAQDSTIIRTRSLSLSTNKSIGPASISASYRLVELDTGGEPTRFHSYNLGLSGGLPIPLVSTDKLTVGLRANYTTNLSSTTPAAPGLNIFQERSVGADVHYRPNLVWNTSLSYDFSQTPLVDTDINRHIANANLNIRPAGNIDLSSSYRLLVLDINDIKTLSHFANIGFNYRPIFGLSTGVNTSLGLTEVSTNPSSETIFQGYNYFINYNRTYELIQFNTGYNLSYGNSKSEPSGETNSNVVNSINFGISNTKTRIVHLSFNYAFFKTDSSQQDSQISNIYALSADSSYFRNLLLNGDSLYLSGSASYTDTQRIGETISLSSNATYYIWRGLSIGGGYTHAEQPSIDSADQDVYFGEAQWVTYLWRRTSLIMSLRDTMQKTGTGFRTETVEARSIFTYQIGKVSLNLEYRLASNESNDIESRTDFFFVRIVRPF